MDDGVCHTERTPSRTPSLPSLEPNEPWLGIVGTRGGGEGAVRTLALKSPKE